MAKRRTSDEAKTWDELAGRLSIPVRRLHEHRHRAGCPLTKSVSDWSDWLETLSPDTGSDVNAKGQDAEIERKIRLETFRKLRIKNDRDEEALVTEAEQAAREIVVAEGKRLRSLMVGLVPGRLAAVAAGKTGAEIETLARSIIEAALQEAKQA